MGQFPAQLQVLAVALDLDADGHEHDLAVGVYQPVGGEIRVADPEADGLGGDLLHHHLRAWIGGVHLRPRLGVQVLGDVELLGGIRRLRRGLGGAEAEAEGGEQQNGCEELGVH